MQILRGFPATPLFSPSFLTLGNFDGIHRGHQQLVGDLVKAAHGEGCLAGLVTFDPHPLKVLRPDLTVPLLTSNQERADVLAALGLDFMLVLPFTRATATTSATDFMQSLTAHIPLRELWVGPDFAMGKDRQGDSRVLAGLGRELGYLLRVVPPYHCCGEVVRSSRVRSLLIEEGAVDRAAELLGRPYQVWGIVYHGAHRGRALGFPTANLELPKDRLIPAHGVYACWAWRVARDQYPASDTITTVPAVERLRGFPAVVNVGVRPSFDNGTTSVEAFLLGFDDTLYHETLGLSFVRRLRGEKRFTQIADLTAQIRADADIAGRVLASPSSDSGAGSHSAWDELHHTADWTIAVRGDSQRQLFANAARAMYTLQKANFGRPAELACAVNVLADDSAGLLVAWLNNLLLQQDLERAVFTHFEIHEISERGLRAVAYGHRGAPIHTAVKAATYYDVEVSETGTGWRATVTFDV